MQVANCGTTVKFGESLLLQQPVLLPVVGDGALHGVGHELHMSGDEDLWEPVVQTLVDEGVDDTLRGNKRVGRESRLPMGRQSRG